MNIKIKSRSSQDEKDDTDTICNLYICDMEYVVAIQEHPENKNESKVHVRDGWFHSVEPAEKLYARYQETIKIEDIYG